LISEKTYLKIQAQKPACRVGAMDIAIVALDPVRVKGLQDPIAVYRVG